jgi:hypothetical protein
MTLKRIVLILLTLIAVLVYGLQLFESWHKPQFQSRLELYQADILLQASAWKGDDSNQNYKIRDAILGAKPLENATEDYQEVSKSAQINLDKIKNQPSELREQSPKELSKFIAELNLRLGILQAQQGEVDKAIKTWQSQDNTPTEATEEVLTGLWSQPARLLPNAEQLIQTNLDGWFRFTTLTKLYQLEQRKEALANLQVSEQQAANQALTKLGIIITIPYLTALIGTGLLIFLIIQRFIKGKDALLAQNANITWSSPWDGETILQVFVVGFFLVGKVVAEFIIPVLVLSLSIPRPLTDARIQALLVLVSYIFVTAGTLSVLYLSVKPFLPLPEGWFSLQLRSRWFLWGLGGYFAAVPIVAIASLLNQLIWQGRGGSNPLLQIVLESRDSLALVIFFSTAAIAAPLFEEILFRGFLLPSLTRYIPVSGAIVLSGFLFALAHLSLSEILPLTTLGIVLGIVYTRSRNLLAPILLHSLWNSGTLLTLFILGGK